MGDEGADHLPSKNAVLYGLRTHGPDPKEQSVGVYAVPGGWQGDFAPDPVQFQDLSPVEGPTQST